MQGSGDDGGERHQGLVVAEGRATNFEHYPPEKIAFTLGNPTWCRRTSADVGPAPAQVIAEFMAINAIHRLHH